MLSRVADSLYWMSRYLERAENTVRQLDVTLNLMLDTGSASHEMRWQQLVTALGNPTGLEWNGNIESMAGKLVFDSLHSRFCDLLRQHCARKCTAGPRRDFDRAVAASQSSLPPDTLGAVAIAVPCQH